jgi:hypothetical protein
MMLMMGVERELCFGPALLDLTVASNGSLRLVGAVDVNVDRVT